MRFEESEYGVISLDSGCRGYMMESVVFSLDMWGLWVGYARLMVVCLYGFLRFQRGGGGI